SGAGTRVAAEAEPYRARAVLLLHRRAADDPAVVAALLRFQCVAAGAPCLGGISGQELDARDSQRHRADRYLDRRERVAALQGLQVLAGGTWNSMNSARNSCPDGREYLLCLMN